MKKTDLALSIIDQHTLQRHRPVTLQQTDVTPYVVYSLLKSVLGPPNGTPAPPKVQWSYEVAVDHAHLRIRDWDRFSWTVDVYHDNQDPGQARRIGQEFVQLVTQQAPHDAKRINRLVQQARYRTLQNPYQTYFSSAENLLRLAENTPHLVDREDLCRAAFFLFLSSFEGLLNVIYDLYLKPLLRDERIRNDVNRANIDLKLRLAPLYCICFSGDEIQYTSDELSRYLAIVELRNDFIHANLLPTMKTPIIEEDGFVFPIEQRETNKYNIPRSLASLEPHHLTFVRQTVQDMVEAVTNSMNHRYKHDFKQALSDPQIMVEDVSGENLIQRGSRRPSDARS